MSRGAEGRGGGGAPLPCTPENIARLCGVAYWRRAVVNAYMRFVAGLPAKN